jgi:hypothetical protein
LGGDHRSAEVCRKVLALQASVYGLSAQVGLPGPTATLGVDGDQAPTDELARLRAKRAGA